MKKIFSMIGAFLAGAMMFSCTEQPEDLLNLCTEISADKTEIEFQAENNEAVEIVLTANGDWMVAAPSWITVAPTFGGAGTTTITVSVSDNMETVVKEDGQSVVEMAKPRKYTLKFAGEGEAVASVNLSQVGDPEKATIECDIAKFLKAEESSDQLYKLTGEIKNLANVEYGNFDLVDATGSVYVYGLTKEKVSKNDKSFASLGLKEGDIVTLIGTRSSYKGTAQVGGPAYYVSHVAGNTPEEPETPAVPTVANIDAIEELGTYNITTATVVAVDVKHMVIKGESRLMNIKYLQKASENYAIGDVISLTNAVVKESYNVTVIDGEAAGLTIEKTGTVEVDHGTAIAANAEWITSFTENLVPEYVTFSGVAVAVGEKSPTSMNVAIEGSDITMSISLANAEEVAAANGKTVTVSGYSYDYNSKNKYISIMMVNFSME